MTNLYQTYMQSYLEEEEREMAKYNGVPYVEKESTEDDGSNPNYKENYIFRDTLQKVFVTPVLSKPAGRESIVEFVAMFMDKHANELEKPGPMNMIPFSDKETNFLYNRFGINKEQILQIYAKVIEDTYFGKISKFITGWIEAAPHKLLIIAILADAIQHQYADIIECCEYLLAFTEYPIIYRVYWKIDPREDIMKYTIEHLGSKYKIKKVPNLQGLLKWDGHSTVARYYNLFVAGGADNVYIDLLRRLRNQINNTLKNISHAYYDNIKLDASQHNTITKFDDGSLADKEGLTTIIAQVIDQTVNKFSTAGINNSLAKVAADGSQVDKGNLIGYISQIQSSKDNKIPKFIENVVTSYFNKYPTNTSIIAGEFVPFGFSLYRSIGTSKDPLYQELRAILNQWMFDIINIRSQYQREATVIGYTRAIFNYYIMLINYYN